MVLFLENKLIFIIELFYDIQIRVHYCIMAYVIVFFFALVDEISLFLVFVEVLNQGANQIPIIFFYGSKKLREWLFFFLDSVHNFFIFMCQNNRIKLVAQIVRKVLGKLVVKPNQRRNQRWGTFQHFGPYSAFWQRRINNDMLNWILRLMLLSFN